LLNVLSGNASKICFGGTATQRQLAVQSSRVDYSSSLVTFGRDHPGVSCALVQSISPSSAYGSSKPLSKLWGHIPILKDHLQTTLPLISARGSGPKIRESRECSRLSPATQQCPSGTCIIMPDLPGVSLSTKSPGIPSTRLIDSTPSLSGCLKLTRSPISIFLPLL